MKKLMNAADTVLAESLDGFAASHADILVLGMSISPDGRSLLMGVVTAGSDLVLVENFR